MPEPCEACAWTLETTWQATALANDTAAWFGRIIDFAVDDRERLYVADLLRHMVLRIDINTGDYASLGRRGRGPGEFELPGFVLPVGRGGVIVYDFVLRRFNEYDDAGALSRSFNLQLMIPVPTDVVTDGDHHIFMSGAAYDTVANDFVIHRFSRAGEYEISFGDADLTFETAADRGRFDGGPMIWDKRRALLWISRGGKRFRLQAYRADGTIVHNYLYDEIEWEPMTLTREAPDGRVVMTAQPKLGSSVLLHLTPDQFVNVRLLTAAGRYEFSQISIPDGRILQRWYADRTDGQPVIPHAVAPNGGVLGVSPDDVPDVVHYRIGWKRR